MRLIAKKPCKFDRQYLIGEEIPVSVVADPKKQEQLGVIAIADGEGASGGIPGALYTQEQLDNAIAAKVAEISSEQPQATSESNGTIVIPILTENGGYEANMSMSSVVDALVIMQKNAKDAEKAIKTVEDSDVLTILNAADSRKSVKDAVAKRLEEVQSSGTGGDADEEEL